MFGHHPLLLSRSSYYVPLPVLMVDSHNQIVDYNVAMEVLLGADIEGCRRQSAEVLRRRVDERVNGNLLPSNTSGVESQRELKMDHGDAIASTMQSEACRYRSDKFGHVDLRRTVIPYYVSRSRDRVGWTFYWQILNIDDEAAFDHALTHERERQLTWDSYAISYDRILPRLPFYQDVVARHVEAMTAPGIEKVIELGAGTGNVTMELLKARRIVTAVDLSRAMLDQLIRKIGRGGNSALTLVEQNAETLSQWDDESFDGVSVLLVLYDMAHSQQALGEAIRVLRPGGVIVVTEPRRCFRLQPLFDFVEGFLRERGLHDSLKEDWDRVNRANVTLDPATRGSPLRAEDVRQRLCEYGFEDVSMKDSHLGNCATVWGRKPVSA